MTEYSGTGSVVDPKSPLRHDTATFAKWRSSRGSNNRLAERIPPAILRSRELVSLGDEEKSTRSRFYGLSSTMGALVWYSHRPQRFLTLHLLTSYANGYTADKFEYVRWDEPWHNRAEVAPSVQTLGLKILKLIKPTQYILPRTYSCMAAVLP